MGNEGARQLTEENACHEQLPLLKDNNQELVHDAHRPHYNEMLDMFIPIPFWKKGT